MTLDTKFQNQEQIKANLGLGMLHAGVEQRVDALTPLERSGLEILMRSFLTRIEQASGQMLCEELEKMRDDGALVSLFGDAFKLMWDADTGKEDPIFHPERNTWVHTLMVVSFLPEDASLELKLGTIFHDIDKPQTMGEFVTEEGQRISQVGHERSGARRFKKEYGKLIHLLSRKSVSPETIERIAAIIEKHGDMHDVKDQRRIRGDVALKNLLQDPAIADFLVLQFADSLGCGLTKEKRLGYVQAEDVVNKMQTLGLDPSNNAQLQKNLQWVRVQVEKIKLRNEDKLGYENWTPKNDTQK